MLQAIKIFFDKKMNLAVATDAQGEDHALRLATAALMMEMARADHVLSEKEMAVVEAQLTQHFSLEAAEKAELMKLAESEAKDATSLYQFTDLIDKNYDYKDKVRVVRMLWEVAYADGHKDKHEEYLVRKVADLLHVSHKDYIRTRHVVEDGS